MKQILAKLKFVSGTCLLVWLDYRVLLAKDGLQFSVEGTVATVAFRADHEASYYQVDGSFVFSVSNSWWQVEVYKQSKDTGRKTIDNCSTIPGGVRHYTLFPGRTNDGSLNGVVVCPITFPPPSENEMLVSWLSLCPSPQLPIVNDQRMRRFLNVPGCPLELLNHPQNEGTFKAAYLNTGSNFLSEWVFWNNGTEIEIGNDNQPEFRRFHGPFENGFLEVKYETLQTTNLGGIIFPLRTLLQRFAPNWATKAEHDVFVTQRTELRVDRINLGVAKHSGSTATPTHMYAFDYRPRNLPPQTPVGYVVHNDQWKQSSDVQIVRLVQMAQESKKIPEGKNENQTKHIVKILIVLTVLAPIVFFLIRRIQTIKP